MSEESPKPNHPEVNWPEEAKEFLRNLYKEKKASTLEEKIAVLDQILGPSNFTSTKIDFVPDQPEGKEFVGSIKPVALEVRLGFLEQIILQNEGLIDEPTSY